jgi:hypothetical protein
LTIVLFVFYCFLFSWLLNKIPFVKNTGLGKWTITGLFAIKILAGILYGYLHYSAPQHVGLTDTWKFFYQGVDETSMLIQDPSSFFRDLLPKEVHQGFGGLLSTSDSYWNDIKHELMVKFASILNLFSGSNYYINTVWYNFITMAGPVALYRTIAPYFSANKIVIFISFLIPSIIFWGSGFHKEGLCFSALALIHYLLVKLYRYERLGVKHLAVGFFSITALLLLRNNLLLPLAPAVAAFVLYLFWRQHAFKIFAGVLVLSVVMFFLSPQFGVDLPNDVSLRQKEFIELGGRTAVKVPMLESNASGFLHNLPSALQIGFLKPYFLEGGVRYIPFTLEVWMLFVFILGAIFRRIKPVEHLPIILFSLLLSTLGLLMIGYTVPNIGAVVRYKSVLTPFLFAGLAMMSRWPNQIKI